MFRPCSEVVGVVLVGSDFCFGVLGFGVEECRGWKGFLFGEHLF